MPTKGAVTRRAAAPPTPNVESLAFRALSWTVTWCGECDVENTSSAPRNFPQFQHERNCSALADRNAFYRAIGREDCIDTGYVSGVETHPNELTEDVQIGAGMTIEEVKTTMLEDLESARIYGQLEGAAVAFGVVGMAEAIRRRRSLP